MSRRIVGWGLIALGLVATSAQAQPIVVPFGAEGLVGPGCPPGTLATATPGGITCVAQGTVETVPVPGGVYQEYDGPVWPQGGVVYGVGPQAWGAPRQDPPLQPFAPPHTGAYGSQLQGFTPSPIGPRWTTGPANRGFGRTTGP